jgi:hypothetical protein
VANVSPGQIWRDACYYFHAETGECMPKYLLVLAVDATRGESITAVFTSKPHGLPTDPPCWQRAPRAGFYVGIPGGSLQKETWVDFSSIRALDDADLANHIAQGRTTLLQLQLPQLQFCSVLRCARGIDDLTIRHDRVIGDLIAHLNCP